MAKQMSTINLAPGSTLDVELTGSLKDASAAIASPQDIEVLDKSIYHHNIMNRQRLEQIENSSR